MFALQLSWWQSLLASLEGTQEQSRKAHASTSTPPSSWDRHGHVRGEQVSHSIHGWDVPANPSDDHHVLGGHLV